MRATPRVATQRARSMPHVDSALGRHAREVSRGGADGLVHHLEANDGARELEHANDQRHENGNDQRSLDEHGPAIAGRKTPQPDVRPCATAALPRAQPFFRSTRNAHRQRAP